MLDVCKNDIYVYIGAVKMWLLFSLSTVERTGRIKGWRESLCFRVNMDNERLPVHVFGSPFKCIQSRLHVFCMYLD